LIEYGFATGIYGAQCNDGLRLVSCAITNAVRCVPPQNKPVRLKSTAAVPSSGNDRGSADLRAIVALGRVAHESVVRAFGLKPPFFHLRMAPYRSWLPHDPAKRQEPTLPKAKRRLRSSTVITVPATTRIPAC